jgi:hypothetical protein
MPALGLTDHRLLTGAVEFVTACTRAGIRPVLGLEIDLEDRLQDQHRRRLAHPIAQRRDPELAERLDRGEYRLVRRTPPRNEGVVDWLLACPEKGFFVPIESESTDAL